MLDLIVKKKLLEKLDNLIAEKKESELLREEFIKWFNSGKPFFDAMNKSEKRILEKYPNLVVKKEVLFNLYTNIKWGSIGKEVFDYKERLLIECDDIYFYSFSLTVYPSFFDFNYRGDPSFNCNKKIYKQVYSKILKFLRVRKKYLKKKEFIKRVLDSRELTLTILKNNYEDLYNLLLEDEKKITSLDATTQN